MFDVSCGGGKRKMFFAAKLVVTVHFGPIKHLFEVAIVIMFFLG